MENKVLIKIYVPEVDDSFDIFVPVNEYIWKIKKLIIKSISDITNIELDIKKDYILINKCSGILYEDNKILINTDIRNATELVITENIIES